MTYSAVHRHDEYPDLAPLPDGFTWTWLEFFHPVAAIEFLDIVAQLPDEEV